MWLAPLSECQDKETYDLCPHSCLWSPMTTKESPVDPQLFRLAGSSRIVDVQTCVGLQHHPGPRADAAAPGCHKPQCSSLPRGPARRKAPRCRRTASPPRTVSEGTAPCQQAIRRIFSPTPSEPVECSSNPRRCRRQKRRPFPFTSVAQFKVAWLFSGLVWQLQVSEPEPEQRRLIRRRRVDNEAKRHRAVLPEPPRTTSRGVNPGALLLLRVVHTQLCGAFIRHCCPAQFYFPNHAGTLFSRSSQKCPCRFAEIVTNLQSCEP